MKTVLSLTILLALVASSAWSQTLTVTASGSGEPGGSPIFDQPGVIEVELAQFDPVLGTLVSVELTVHAEHAGTFTFTANGPNQRYQVNWLDWSYEVNGLGGDSGNLLLMDWVTEPTANDPFGAPPGHFNTALTLVPEGETVALPYGNSLSYEATFLPSDPEFAWFAGNGVFTIEMLDWMVFSVTTYGGNNAWNLSTNTNLEVTAVYHYEAAVSTEPSSWGGIKALLR